MREIKIEYSTHDELIKQMEKIAKKGFCKYPNCNYCTTCLDNERKTFHHCGICGEWRGKTYPEYLEHRNSAHPDYSKGKE